MPKSQPKPAVKISLVRAIALRELRQPGSGEQHIRECYLFKDEYFCGIRYEAGPIRFIWNTKDDFASIERGGLVIESVSLVPGSEERRAA